jgi:GNAT superfamily N-acetyltransferase
MRRRSYSLHRATAPLRVDVPLDQITAAAIEPFDLAPSTPVEFYPWQRPHLRPTWTLGLIVGASGSGKSTLLRSFGEVQAPTWDSRAIAAHFGDATTAMDRFHAVGLNAVPTWRKPYSVLSNGERFRADLARVIGNGAVIDEYTSVVSRPVAESTSAALRKWVDRTGTTGMVLASCHYDIIDWLQPDWIIDCSAGTYRYGIRTATRWWHEHVGTEDGRLHHGRHVVKVWNLLQPAAQTMWANLFAAHHYLTAELSGAAQCWLATWDDDIVGFASVLRMKGRYGITDTGASILAWREHRTVVLPDYQGMGLGMALSDWLASFLLIQHPEDRFYSRTTHPRMAAYRNASPTWRETKKSGKQRKDFWSGAQSEAGVKHRDYDADTRRLAWSHQYVGRDPLSLPTH